MNDPERHKRITRAAFFYAKSGSVSGTWDNMRIALEAADAIEPRPLYLTAIEREALLHVYGIEECIYEFNRLPELEAALHSAYAKLQAAEEPA